MKAATLMQGTSISTALVSTNSISQGEQVPILWEQLYKFGLEIIFAHRTFRWDSEASVKAHVHCVIIGFSSKGNTKKLLYTSDSYVEVENVNPYLVEAPNVLVTKRSKPFGKVAGVVFGSMPNDGGHLSDWTTEEKDAVLSKYPDATVLFRPFLGASEFLHNKKRWCLWLKNIEPKIIKRVTPVMDAVLAVKELREKSNRESTKKLADAPMLFGEIRQPEGKYIIVPRHSSENRKYVPIGFVESEVICGDANLLVPDGSLYLFGILMSNVHNAWIRTVCGRLKSDYRYSGSVVYNNFPWCNPTEAQRAKIEKTAQGILDARALYPDSSLADLYGVGSMPDKLVKAHKANDRAVMEAYGFWGKCKGESDDEKDNEIVAGLMKMYQKLIEE